MRRLGWAALLVGLIWHGLALGSLHGGYLDPLFHDSSRDIGDDARVDYGKGLDFFSILALKPPPWIMKLPMTRWKMVPL